MELFEHAFSEGSIYDMLFINVKSVLEYPDVEQLRNNKPHLFKQWELLAKTKYHMDTTNTPKEAYDILLNDVFKKYAVYYPEYSKIVGISYAQVENVNNVLKRKFKKIILPDELEIIETFQQVLHQFASAGLNSNPPSLLNLCGHNIINYDIPLYIKRVLNYRTKLMAKDIPFMFKHHLQSKPWDTNVIDTVNIWKFKGKEYTSLNLIVEYLGLKKTTDLLSMSELSDYYWENIETDPDKVFEAIGLQSATQTNLIIQMINELRTL